MNGKKKNVFPDTIICNLRYRDPRGVGVGDINLARYLFLGVNTFFWYVVTYMWIKNLIYVFLICENIYDMKVGMGGGDINACCNFIN